MPQQQHPSGGTHAHVHIGELVNQIISPIAPYSALILTITTVAIAFVRIYGLDIFLPKLYAEHVFRNLDPIQKRSFINHHVAAITKVIVLLLGAYPFLKLTIGGGAPNTPIAPGSSIVIGDVLIVVSQIFCGMYIFELFYRDRISPISFAHHVGAIVIAQAVVAMSINWDHTKDAIYEFILAFVWGAFDVVAEFWPHLCMILYRLYPDNHGFLSKLFFSCTCIELFGTILETGIVMWLFGSLWYLWSDSLKIVTPILHLLFTAAQLWGAWILLGLAKHQRQLCKKHMDSDKSSSKAESV